MQYIDAHIHFAPNADEVKILDTWGVKLLNICVAYGNWRQREAEPFQQLSTSHSDGFAWCTTFDLPHIGESVISYVDRIIPQLQKDFDAGAAAVKVWKNIGMELRDDAGNYVFIDAPIFEPIFKFIEKSSQTLIMHIGEPYACWRPLSPESPHYHYLRNHPEWHMWGRKDSPSHAALMAARDHVLERHPTLRVVGAHLGSLEYDLDEMAQRFDKYENFAVDTSARMKDLAMHGTVETREFFDRFQDRILWGSDFEGSPGGQPVENPLEILQLQYELEQRFYTTDSSVQLGAKTASGLNLSKEVSRKLFFSNARYWFPNLPR